MGKYGKRVIPGNCKKCGNIIYNKDRRTISRTRTECDNCVLDFLRYIVTDKSKLEIINKV